MTKVLGIDFGRRKIGLAIGDTENKLTEPHLVLRFKNQEDAVDKVVRTAISLDISDLVLGISEGKTADDIKEFGKALEKKFGKSIVYQDESLSTLDAQEMSRAAGINRSRRKRMEDAFAAAVMLQNYLDFSI